MPPRRWSRHTFTLAFRDEQDPDETQLTERTPFAYRELNDNVQHQVKEGDTLQTLAAKYFKGVDRSSQLWWVIADFQPDPIFDPTIKLTLGSTVVVPSMRTLSELIFSETRRSESEQ
jgi:hypothetical protein